MKNNTARETKQAEKLGRLLFLALNAIASSELSVGAEALQIAVNKCRANALGVSADGVEKIRKAYLWELYR